MLTRRNKELKDVFENAAQSAHIENSLLLNADSLELLSWFPDSYFDSVVTDPPYGIEFMGKEWDCIGPKTSNKQIKAFYFQKWCYEWAKEVLRVLKPGAMMLAFCSPRMVHRLTTGVEDAGFEIRDQLQWLSSYKKPASFKINGLLDRDKSIQSYDTAQWDGWETFLKPTNEPIVLARKPLGEKNIALNISKHGTGGLNVDACRIGESGGTKAVVKSKSSRRRRLHGGGISNDVKVVPIKKGLHPSNTIIDEEVARLLGDKSRFFYTAKVSPKERNAGCEHLEAKPQNCEGKKRTYNDRCAKCGKKFTGSLKYRCHCPGKRESDKTVYKNKNNHDTVKPISLMEHLVKLVTPKGGICLDLFVGSGGTGIACVLNNFSFIGIEREPDYYEISKARIEYWSKQKKVA